MNDHIHKLAEKAGASWDPKYHWYVSDNIMQKFAELLIQRCISEIALLGVSNYENDDIGWVVDKSIKNIRDHFGVK